MSKTAFLFPGQGVQKAGMGKDFYEHSAVAREIFDMASEVLQMDMKKLCFTENEKLNQTEYTLSLIHISKNQKAVRSLQICREKTAVRSY